MITDQVGSCQLVHITLIYVVRKRMYNEIKLFCTESDFQKLLEEGSIIEDIDYLVRLVLE